MQATIPDTKSIFVPRRDEQKRYTLALARSDVQFLAYEAPPGFGKTVLLSKFLSLAREHKVVCSGILDFHNVDTHERSSLLLLIQKRLDPKAKHFQSFLKEHKAYTMLVHKSRIGVRGIEEIEESVLKAALEKVLARFFADYYAFAESGRVVLLFDTFEEVAGLDVGKWLLYEFVDQVKNTVIVVAGRPQPTEKDSAGREISPGVNWSEQVRKVSQAQIFKLGKFSREDTAAFCEATKQGFTPGEVARLHKLSGGEPLTLALLIDSIREGQNLKELEELKPLRPSRERSFQAELINRIMERDPEVGSTLLAMAHGYYRFNPQIFAVLLPELKSASKQVIARVRKYSFVKCFEHDECLLHDQARDDIVKFLWGSRDTNLVTRKQYSEILVSYYEGILRSLKEDDPIYDTYKIEELYHGLIANPEKYYYEFWEVLDKNWHATKYDYMYSLLKMARQRLRLQEDPILNRLEKGARMWMLLEKQWDTKQAFDISKELIQDHEGLKRILATALAVNGICHARLGNSKDAFPSLDRALVIYNELYDALKAGKPLPEEHGVATLHGVKPERFLVLNTKGRVFRQLGRFPQARKEYEKSEELSKREDDRRWEASALTGLANIWRYEGKFNRAYDFVRRAIDLREQLYKERIVGPGAVALSYNVMGMIYRDDGFLHNAKDAFNHAIKFWELANAQGDIPLGWRNLGRVAHDEQRYGDAEELFLKSKDVFLELDNQRELPDLYEKMGRLYYDMGRVLEAKTTMEEGLGLARRFGDALLMSNFYWELARVALYQKDYKLIAYYARELKKFEREGYEFHPAYANMEFVLGDWRFVDKKYDAAFDHYGRGYAYLTGSAERRFRRHLDRLRVNLLQLEPKVRERQCLRLIRFWEQDPDRPEKFPELTELCRNFRVPPVKR